MENFYESYNFGGFMEVKFSYSLYNKSQFSDEFSTVEITNNKDFNKFLYGLSLSVGYIP
jgi:hypothetical protein